MTVPPKIKAPILVCWLRTTEARFSDMTGQVKRSRQYTITFSLVSDSSLNKMASDMKQHTKQRLLFQCQHAERTVHIDHH